MTCSRYVHVAILVISAVLASSRSYAQTGVDSPTTSGGYVNLQTSRNLFAVPNDRTTIRQYLADTQLSNLVFYVSRDEASAYQSSGVGRQRSTGRKVVGGIIGGVGGSSEGHTSARRLKATGATATTPALPVSSLARPSARPSVRFWV